MTSYFPLLENGDDAKIVSAVTQSMFFESLLSSDANSPPILQSNCSSSNAVKKKVPVRDSVSNRANITMSQPPPGRGFSAQVTPLYLSQFYHLPIDEAARRCGVSATIIKRACRRLGIEKWPYRRIHSVEKQIQNAAILLCRAHGSEKLKLESKLRRLMFEKDNLVQSISVGDSEFTDTKISLRRDASSENIDLAAILPMEQPSVAAMVHAYKSKQKTSECLPLALTTLLNDPIELQLHDDSPNFIYPNGINVQEEKDALKFYRKRNGWSGSTRRTYQFPVAVPPSDYTTSYPSLFPNESFDSAPKEQCVHDSSLCELSNNHLIIDHHSREFNSVMHEM